jgi:hypothetical protein
MPSKVHRASVPARNSTGAESDTRFRHERNFCGAQCVTGHGLALGSGVISSSSTARGVPADTHEPEPAAGPLSVLYTALYTAHSLCTHDLPGVCYRAIYRKHSVHTRPARSRVAFLRSARTRTTDGIGVLVEDLEAGVRCCHATSGFECWAGGSAGW